MGLCYDFSMENHGLEIFNQAAQPSVFADIGVVFSKLRNHEPISLQQADQVAAWVIHETTSVLLKVLHEELAATSTQFNAAVDVSAKLFRDRCSFSQCVAAYGLIDQGLTPKPFSLQFLPGCTVGHALLTLELPTHDGPALYLIDPTYRQFFDPNDPEYNGYPLAGFVLERLEGGAEIGRALYNDRYLRLTPEKADIYLSAFFQGKSPFESPEQAFAYMKDPPYDNAYHWFNRDIMEKSGYTILALQVRV